MKLNGHRLVPYLPESLSHDKKIRHIAAFISENGKGYLDKIIDQNDIKKDLNDVSKKLDLVQKRLKSLNEKVQTDRDELKILSCETKMVASLYKFELKRGKIRVLKAKSSKSKKEIDLNGPLQVGKKEIKVCLPKKEDKVGCQEFSSRKIVSKQRDYQNVFKTMNKRGRYGWVKTSGWDKKVNILEIKGVKYLCPSKNTFKYKQDKIENFPYSIAKKIELEPSLLDEKKEDLKSSIEKMNQEIKELPNEEKRLTEEKAETQENYDSLDKESNEKLQEIVKHLDVDLDNDEIIGPEEYKNYLKVNSEETKLTFKNCEGKRVPFIKIKRDTVFETKLADGSFSKGFSDLTYESSGCERNEKATIVDVQYFVEKNTPILKFKIKELGQSLDKITGEIVNLPTGKTFHVKLKQNKAPFGIEFVGEFDYTDESGKILRTGIMKWAFVE
jgi:prefoldin subunit 5